MGVVSDSETGETLPFANVFFTGTTYGSVTDVNGFFEIELKDKGTYELIVKFVGYDTYATTVEVLSNNDLRFDIKLNLSSVNLGSVVVVMEEEVVMVVVVLVGLGRGSGAGTCGASGSEG